jgi:MSHA biogenesis protein MshP
MRHARRIRGFAIVSAIFILVVLAALGAFIVNISTNQQIGSAIDVLGVRAYQAARAGIEWGLYQVQASPSAGTPYNFSYGTPSAGVGTAAPNTRVCPTTPTSFVPAASTLSGFTVTVTCSSSAADGFSGPTIYSLTATACSQPLAGSCPNTTPGNLYIERRLSVSF